MGHVLEFGCRISQLTLGAVALQGAELVSCYLVVHTVILTPVLIAWVKAAQALNLFQFELIRQA